MRAHLAPLALLIACRVASTADDRSTDGRLFRSERWKACSVTDSSGVVPRVKCGLPASAGSSQFVRLAASERAARERLESDSSPGALRAMAYIDLRWRDAVPVGLDRAIALLEIARAASPSDVATLNDVAVAYLEQGERDQQLKPMLQALDAIQQAAEHDSVSPQILFNRALILERLYLVESAERAWRQAVKQEPDSEWRREMDAHVASLTAAIDVTAWPTDASLDSLAAGSPRRAWVLARIRASPGRARDLAFTLLGAWGATTGRTAIETPAERDQLSLVRSIADTLAAMGADASVSLALSAVDESRQSPARLRTLGDAHAAFSTGLSLFFHAKYAAAMDTLRRAERGMRSAGSPTARWALSYWAAAAAGLNKFEVATKAFRNTMAEASTNQPALVGKNYSGLGVVAGRRGRYEIANELHRHAVEYVERAQEPENWAALSYYIAENLDLSGQLPAGRREAFRGLRLLSPYRTSSFLSNHLFTVAAAARADHLRRAAAAIMEEHLRVARRLGRPDGLAFGLCTYARDLDDLGHAAAAQRALDEAAAATGELQGDIADRHTAAIEFIRARIIRPDDPSGAQRMFARVVDAYRRLRVELLMPETLYESAVSARAAGDSAAARRDLDDAIRRIEHQRLTFGTAETRAALDETAEEIYDAMIELELSAKRPASAFGYLERERNNGWLPTRSLATVGHRLPADVALVEYAVLPHSLAIWTASNHGVGSRLIEVGRDSIATLVASFRREAEVSHVAGTSVRASLFDILLRPVLSELTGFQTIAVVPDRELARIPFAALWDRDAQRYAIEQFAILTEQSAGFLLAARAGHRRDVADARVLVIGNPALDSADARTLTPLPGAEREAALVSATYRNATSLTGAAASRSAVTKALRHSSVVHFAGHTVFNPDQPELSYLALASDDSTTGVVRAREIGAMSLSNLQLVVLSSCTSLAARPTRAGALAGLAYSFLRAGAPATVSTVFDVNDEQTTPLLARFHRHYADGMPGVESLRQAQLETLRLANGSRRAPSEWAGFVYSGW